MVDHTAQIQAIIDGTDPQHGQLTFGNKSQILTLKKEEQRRDKDKYLALIRLLEALQQAADAGAVTYGCFNYNCYED
jgi:hypothetical protein